MSDSKPETAMMPITLPTEVETDAEPSPKSLGKKPAFFSRFLFQRKEADASKECTNRNSRGNPAASELIEMGVDSLHDEEIRVDSLEDLGDSIKMKLALMEEGPSKDYIAPRDPQHQPDRKDMSRHSGVSSSDGVMEQQLDSADELIKKIDTKLCAEEQDKVGVPPGWGCREASKEHQRSVAPEHSACSSNSSSAKWSQSAVSCSGDDIELTEEDLNEMPDSLQVEQADIFLIVSDEDKAGGRNLQDRLEELEYEGRDGEKRQCKVHMVDDMHANSSIINSVVVAQETSTFIFLLVTPNFCSDSVANFQKNDTMMRHLHSVEQKWSIVPIYTQRKGTFKIPNGLDSYKSLDLSRLLKNCSIEELDQLDQGDIYFKRGLLAMLKARGSMRRSREIKQEREKGEWIREMKLYVRQRGAEEQQRKQRQHEQEEADFQKMVENLPKELSTANRDQASYGVRNEHGQYPLPGKGQHQMFTPVQASTENPPFAYMCGHQAAAPNPCGRYSVPRRNPEDRQANITYHISATNVQVGAGTTIVSHEPYAGTFEEDEADVLDRRYNRRTPYPVASGAEGAKDSPPPAAHEDNDIRLPSAKQQNVQLCSNVSNRQRRTAVESSCLELPDVLASRGVEIDNSSIPQDLNEGAPAADTLPAQEIGTGHDNTVTHAPSNTADGALYTNHPDNFVRQIGVELRVGLPSGPQSFLDETVLKCKHS